MMRQELLYVAHILPVNDKCVQQNRYRSAMFCESDQWRKLLCEKNTQIIDYILKELEKATPTRKVYMYHEFATCMSRVISSNKSVL
jgi:hypothetical protein